MAEYFTLDTGSKIPSIGLGTWQAAPGVVGDAVVAAVKAGYRHIDCARLYGNEKELDYVDLYLIHWPVLIKKGTTFGPGYVLPLDMAATWGAFEKLYDSGKALGDSNFSTKKLADLITIARVRPAVNQVECHPGCQQDKLKTFCQSNGVHLSAYSPLSSPGTTWMKGNVLTHPSVNTVAEKLGKTPAQVTLRWGIQMGHSVLPKSTS